MELIAEPTNALLEQIMSFQKLIASFFEYSLRTNMKGPEGKELILQQN
jgi:hypothetical protein